MNGPNDYNLYNIQPPVGSIVAGGPPFVVEICGTIAPNASIGDPLTITTRPIFQFGDSATGTTAILGDQQVDTITPSIVRFEKVLIAPEGERPPGASWPATYELVVDIANGNTIYDLNFADVIPADMQYVAPITIVSGTTGATCTPSVLGQSINVTCDEALGSLTDTDLVIRYQAYVKDVLSEDQCQTLSSPTLDNTATFNANRHDASNNNVALGPIESTEALSSSHVEMQKLVTPGVLPSVLVSPGDTLTYTINIQTSDFGTVKNLILNDLLPDGLNANTFAHVSMIVNGTNTPITATITPHPTNGTIAISYDIGGAVPGNIPSGSSIQLIYTIEILQSYAAGGSHNGEVIKANDFLTNVADITYELTEGAVNCNDGSSATATIKDVGITKEIVNNPLPTAFQPEDIVTYRLTMQIPSGDTANVVFSDFFPLPVFDVDSITDVVFGAGHPIRYAPTDNIGAPSPTIAKDSANNKLTLTWPLISTNTAGPHTLAVDVDIAVGSDPFADGLQLSNIFQADTENTPNTAISDLGLTLVNVRAPKLVVNKGVIQSTNPNSTISPAIGASPENSNLLDADAGDTVTYQITVENVGGAKAYDVVITDDLGVPATLLGSCNVTSVQDGSGANLNTTPSVPYAGGVITLDDPLDSNDGTLGAPYSSDTAIATITCDVDPSVQPSQVITNTSSVDWASSAGNPNKFPAVEDTATVSIKDLVITKTLLGADTTFTIGQILTYQIEIEVPELTINNFIIHDQLDPGLAFVSFTDPTKYSLGFSSGDVTSSQSIFNVTNSGSTLALDLGTVTNANTNDGTTETITLTYDVVVLNDTDANAGNNKNNSANFTSTTSNSGNVSANNITIVEPHIDVTKTVITNGPYDAGDTVTYDWFVRQVGSNLSDAFEVTLVDTLPSNVTYVGGSLQAVGACANLTLDDSNASTTLNAGWTTFTTNQVCHIRYDVTLNQAVTSGSDLVNTVAIDWSSLNGTVDTTVSAYNNNACERTSANNNANCGSANDYDDTSNASIHIGDVTIAKVLTNTSVPPSITGDAQHDAGEADLSIGETATFTLTVTIPEGTSDVISITDNLPNGPGRMEYVSSTITSIGANLKESDAVTQLVAVAPTVSGGTVVNWNFGQVVNIGNDNIVDDADRIIIEITGVVKENALNVDGTDLTNNSTVNFGAGLNGTSNVNLDVVEPKLQINKTSVTTTADAGDTVSFSIQVSHTGASTQDAFDIEMKDIVPSGMTYVGGTLAAATCDVVPLTIDESAPATTGLLVVLNNLPLAQSCTITFDVTLDPTVNPGQEITNNASLIWDSLDADLSEPDDEREYTANNSHKVTISRPGLIKVVTDTSVGATDMNAPGTDLTIGEQVTYQFTTTIPEGITNNVVILDQLPTTSNTSNTDVALEYVSSRIVSVGGQMTLGAHAVNDSGDDCTAPCDLNNDGYRDQAQWDLGTVTNQPDGDPANDTIVFEVIAIVVNDSINTTADDDVRNVASISFDNTDGSAATPITGDVAVDLAEPILNISKKATPAAATFFANAGDVVTFEILVEHDATSDADAYNLEVTDTLANDGTNALMNWNGDANIGGTCGAAVNSGATAASPFQAVFTVPSLALGSSCTITYQVVVDVLAQPSQTLTNKAVLAYDSTSTHDSLGETRTSTTDTQADVVINDVTGLVKMVTSTSHNGATGTGLGGNAEEDLTIGEMVTYTITMQIPEGTTQNVMLTDSMPIASGGQGVIELLSTNPADAPTISFGSANISSTSSVISVNAALDGFSINLGTVTNTPDNDNSNDTITITVTGIVTDVVDNADGKHPVNTAHFTFTDGDGKDQDKSDTATVDIVSPKMEITKSMTVLDGLVTVTVALQNTGTATAYDIEIKDVLNSTNWDTANITSVTVPNGYTLSTVPGPGGTETTVVMASDATSNAPDNSVEVNETVTFVFTVPAQPNVASIDNTATNTSATTLPGGPDVERNVAPVDDTKTIKIPLVSIVKTAATLTDTNLDGDIGSIGDVVTFNFTITNTGGVPLTNITVSDINPDVTVTGNPIVLAVGADDSINFVGIYTITQDDVDSGSIENTATVSADNSTGSPVTDSDSETVDLVQKPKLTIVKTADDTTDVVVGQEINYTYEITNTGNVTIENVTITDDHQGAGISPVPGNESITENNSGLSSDASVDAKIDSLASGDVATFISTYIVTQQDINNSADITNTATVEGEPKPAGLNSVSAEASESVDLVDPDPVLSITKQASDTTNVVAGQEITYTYVVTNIGNVAINNVSITDLHSGIGGSAAPAPGNELITNNPDALSNDFGVNGSINSLSVGGEATFTATYIVTQADIDASNDITNTATVHGTPTSGDFDEPQAQEVVGVADPDPILSVVKFANVTTVGVDQVITYTYVITNTGNITINNVTVNDVHSGFGSPAPNPDNGVITSNASGLSTDSLLDSSIDTLAPGDTATFKASYTVIQADIDANLPITNVATATGEPIIGNLASVAGNESVETEAPSPSMSITKTADVTSDVRPGDIITYTYVVTNTGNVTIDDITITDEHSGTGIAPVPGNEVLTNTSGLSSDSSVNGSVDVLSPGDFATFTATYEVTQEDVAKVKDITNIATANGDARGGTVITPPSANAAVGVHLYSVPTLSEWSRILLIILLGLFLYHYGRASRRSAVSSRMGHRR